MIKVIKNKIRLLSKSGFLASSLLNNVAMEKRNLCKFINSTNKEYKPEQDISRIGYYGRERNKLNEYVIKNYEFNEKRFYNFFSNIEINKLDISNIKLENVKFNSLFNNSIINELIISPNNFIKQELDYFNQNLEPRAKINKITLHINNNEFSFINDSNENYDLLIKIILNNIDKIKDNDSFETIKSKFIKIKDKITEERKNFIDKVNKEKEFKKDEKSYYYDLHGTTISKFNINISETLINIDLVRTLGSYSGCGLLKSLISEIYKENGILPIVLKQPTTIGKEVYKRLGFVYYKNIGLESAINLTKNITNDCRILHWMLDKKNNDIFTNYDMVLLPIKENIKKIFFKDNDEGFIKIENTFEKFLYDYKNNDILKEYYIEYIKKNKFSEEYKIFQYIKDFILEKDIDTIKDAEEYYKSIFKNEEFKRIISEKKDKEKIKNEVIKKVFDKKIFKFIKNVILFQKGYIFESFKNESKSLQNKFNNTKNDILNEFDDNEKKYFEVCDLFIEYIKQGHKHIAFNESDVYINDTTIEKIKKTSNDLFFQNKDLLNFHKKIDIHNIQELTNKKNSFSLKYLEFINISFKKYSDYQKFHDLTEFNAYIENLKKDFDNNKKDKNEIEKLLSELVGIRTSFYNECTNFLYKNIPDYLYSFLFYYINMDFFNISNELSSIIEYINTYIKENFVESDNDETDNDETDNDETDNDESDNDESGD